VKAIGLFAILFLACGTVQSQSLRVLPVQIRGGQGFPAAIQFYCTEKYSRADCQNDIFVLSRNLGRYSLEKLGPWTFVLASSDEWESIMTQLHLPKVSPVFSALKSHITVMSQTLFSGPADQRVELAERFRSPLDRLLDLAITHELGHAFCQERDEGKATVYGEQLRAGQTPTCEAAGSHHEIAATNQESLTTISSADMIALQGQKNSDAPASASPSPPGKAPH